jgi:peptidoglycan-associated lipoprotein
MMRRISTSTDLRWVAILLAFMLAFAAGCASTPEPAEDAGDTVDSEFDDAASQAPVPDSSMDDTNVANRSFNIAPVYFDFDRAEIRSEFGSILSAGADSLKDSGATAVIEGHTDERGSEEYNVALGERRAVAVRKYLYNLGVPMAQMSVVSYGEARPAVSGTGETAWQLNRRAEFRVR